MFEFLKMLLMAKHWQIFIIIFLLPLFVSPWFALTLYVWLWGVSNLQSLLHDDLKSNYSTFQFCLIGAVMCSIAVLVISDFILVSETSMFPNSDMDYFRILLTINFIGMICTIYCIFYVSKTLKTLELNRNVNFSDFFKYFFLVWFIPIGIWVIQPKINSIFIKEIDE
jgi:hypothetical protein